MNLNIFHISSLSNFKSFFKNTFILFFYLFINFFFLLVNFGEVSSMNFQVILNFLRQETSVKTSIILNA